MNTQIYNETKDHSATAQTIADAIGRSIADEEIVTIDGDEHTCAALRAECDGEARNGRVHGFWGTDIDGDVWTVHVRL